tara:strand:+ start:770 stop:1081 length:312 start_codon:yes stop_codon:yes gene_type:complete
MRKITQDSINAFLNQQKFYRDNTSVEVLPNVTILKLFGNKIAYLYNNPQKTLSITNCSWFTNTTKDRLNALPNVHIQQKTIKGKKEWYLNNKEWNGELIDIKK